MGNPAQLQQLIMNLAVPARSRMSDVLANPQDSSLPHFVHNDRMVKVAKTIGRTALGDDFIPKEFTRDAALAALSAVGETVTPMRPDRAAETERNTD